MNPRAAAIILSENQILLVRRINNGREYWVLPGGSIEKGENAEQACRREVNEETGLTIEIIRLLTHFENKGRMENYFLARSCGGTLQLGEPEFSRQTEDDRYILEWTDVNRLDKVNLQPSSIMPVIADQAISSNSENF